MSETTPFLSDEEEETTHFYHHPAFIPAFVVGFILTLIYAYSIKFCMPEKTSRFVFLMAYVMLVAGSVGGWLGLHGLVFFMDKVRTSVCVKAVVITLIATQLIGTVPFNYLLPKSQLQLPKTQRPPFLFHIAVFLISAVFSIFFTFRIVGVHFEPILLGLAIGNGYVGVVGARLLWIAMTTSSLSIVKDGKIVGKLLRKEDGEWTEVESLAMDENALKNGFC